MKMIAVLRTQNPGKYVGYKHVTVFIIYRKSLEGTDMKLLTHENNINTSLS